MQCASASKFSKSADRLGLFVGIFICLLTFLPVTVRAGSRPDRIIIGFEQAARNKDMPPPWQIKVRYGNAGVALTADRGETVLHLSCVNASFGVERPVSISPRTHPVVYWSWRVVKLPEAGDVRNKMLNDQALQLMFLFEGNRIISYVWDANAPKGTITDESVGWPMNLRVKVLVVASGRVSGSWQIVRRNILEDYKKLFHEEPAGLIGMRIKTNTQYTHDNAEGFVRSVIFSGASDMGVVATREGVRIE